MTTNRINFLEYQDHTIMNIIMEYINNYGYKNTKTIIQEADLIVQDFIRYFKLENKHIEFLIKTQNGNDLLLEFKNTVTRNIFNMKISKLMRLLKLEKLNNIVLIRDAKFIEINITIGKDDFKL